MTGIIAAADKPALAAASARAVTPALEPAPETQLLIDGVGPIGWNAAVSRDRGSGVSLPSWPAVRVLGQYGAESLYVFPDRAQAPMLIASWPRQAIAEHSVRIFPGFRWIVVESPVVDESIGAEEVRLRARFYAANGAFLWETPAGLMPAALGRNLVLAPRPSTVDSIPPRVAVLRLPEGNARASWPAVGGWGASSPLENFLAANTIGLFDPATGLRQDELRLLDLEGKILWARTIAADQREFAVSNFGDVAIAREGRLAVFDRYGAEKLRAALPRNRVGRTAITPDGRFALVATCSPLGKGAGGGLWIALYDTSRKTPVWSRRNLAEEAGKNADVLELSLSDDGQRALVRLTTGSVVLLSRDGHTIVTWKFERVSRGEYDPGSVPRRTWLSGDGALVALTTPVARSLAEARGWLYRVAR
jgi:hypothetical protein